MLHDHTNENKKSSQTKQKTNEIEKRSKPRRAQGVKGLLSHSISVQRSQKSISKIQILEKKRKNREVKRGARKRAACLVTQAKERESGEGERYLSPTNFRLKD